MASSTCIHCPNVSFIPRGLDSRKFICFLKKRGLSNGVSSRDSVHKFPHVIGEELTTLRVSEAVLPCPESLQEGHGGTLADVIENFPHLPDTETEVVPLPATKQRCGSDSKKLEAVLRVSVAGPSGSLPPHILYLLEIGFDLEQIKKMAWKDPYFANRNLEKIRQLVEFLLDIGVSKSDLPSIIVKYPQLCGMSLSENVISRMEFLETLGVDKTKWGKVMSRCPSILGYSRQKIEATVEFLDEMGLSKELIGKLITNCPVIVGLSIEDQLRPKAEYFRSLGVDVAVLLRYSPHIMGLSMEAKLKPITEFFLESGFSREDVGTMLSRCPRMYTLSFKGSLIPKWEFFLTMDYPRSDLLKHAHYFSYNLEDRIKPRYNLMKEFGVKLSLYQLLRPTPDQFKVMLEKKIKKLQLGLVLQLISVTADK